MKAPTALALALLLPACGGNVTPAGSSGTTGGTGGAATSGATAAASTSSSSASAGGASSSSSSSSAGTGGAVTCGKVGPACPPHEYCAFPLHNCGTGDDMGKCAPEPPDCTGVDPDPVCGCDGKLYAAACWALRAGVDVSTGSSCLPPPGSFACGSSLFCKVGQELCAYNLQEPLPMCSPLPASCLPPNAADCACLANDFCFDCKGSTGELTASCGGG